MLNALIEKYERKYNKLKSKMKKLKTDEINRIGREFLIN